MRFLPLIAILLFTVITLSGCEEPHVERVPPSQVKIGIIGPFSGNDRQWGENGLLGVRAALEYHKQRYRQRTVKLHREDDQNDPVKAQAALDRLVREEKVDAVIVLSDSRIMLAIAEVADDYQTPIIATLSTHPNVTKSSWVSQVMFDDKSQGLVAALFVIDELLIERISVLWDGADPHSKVLAESFMRTYQKAGGSLISVDLSGTGRDYQKILNQLQKNGIDFVYLPVDATKVVNLEQAARTIGYNPQIMVSDGVLSQMMLGYADTINLVEGMLATDMYSYGVPMSDFGEEMASKFKELFKSTGTTIAALGCEGTHVVLTAIENCGSNPQNECINRTVRGGYEFEGLLGPFIIDLNGKALRPVFINRIEGNRLSFLIKVH